MSIVTNVKLVEFCPYGFAGRGFTHSPLAGQGIHQHESETGLIKPGRSPRLRPVRVGVLDLDPQPSSRGFKFQRYRVGVPSVPDRVRDQHRHEQYSALLNLSQPPCD